jgi:dUTP pyrophosphatase
MAATVRYRMETGCEDLAPRKAHADDAAYDLRSRIDALMRPGEVRLIPTGLFLELPAGYEAQVRPRSGVALKKAVTVLNSPGTIDAGYRGEVGVILYNAGIEDFRIERGDRVAQMVIQRLPEVVLERVEALADSSRSTGGFGSTGRK